MSDIQEVQGVQEDGKLLEEKRKGRFEQKKYEVALARIHELETRLGLFDRIEQHKEHPTIEPQHDLKDSGIATVFAIGGDWHVDEIVDSKKVQGRNMYNPNVAKRRASTFFQRIVRLTDKERQDIPIDHLVLCLLGDFISGNIHDELLENTSMCPIEAIIFAEELLVAGIEFLQNHGKFKKITVICKSGNHARITKKLRFSTEAGNSLEYGLYHALARKFPNCEWIIEPGYLTYYRIYGRTIRIHHGWAIRSCGGVGGIYPALLRREYQWNIQEPAQHSLLGHFHTYTSVGRGNIIINGSLIGFNPFAETLGLSPEPPTQALFLLDRKRGVTVQIPILVDS